MRLIIPFLPVVVVIRLERRPRTPLRLKTLLAVVLAAGLGLGWVARNVHRVEAQPAVIWVLIAQVLRHPSSLR